MRRYCIVFAAFIAAACPATRVTAFSTPATSARLRVGKRNCVCTHTASRAGRGLRSAAMSEWATVSDEMQEIFDGSLKEGLERSAWEGNSPAIEQFNMEVVHKSPPLFRIPNFLTPEECEQLIQAAIQNGEEATEYLNARVNSEVKGAQNMPERASGYSEEATNEAVEWSGGATSGLRRRLPRDAFRMLDERILAMLGEVAEGREIDMVEAIYVRPDARTVIVRDATLVHYTAGEGVAPHVDGKDATLLCYLNEMGPGAGGRTVFPEVKVAAAPKLGDALLYDSRKDLLHFAEPVAAGHEKWVMQLLIDFKYVKQPGGMHVDFKTGKVTKL